MGQAAGWSCWRRPGCSPLEATHSSSSAFSSILAEGIWGERGGSQSLPWVESIRGAPSIGSIWVSSPEVTASGGRRLLWVGKPKGGCPVDTPSQKRVPANAGTWGSV